MSRKSKHNCLARILGGCILAMLLSACSVTKYVPDGEYLLDNVELKYSAPKISTTELTPYLKQQPNFRVFGLARLRLRTYCLSGRDTSKRRNRWLRRVGEPPVIYDDYSTIKTDKQLEQYFKQKGYLNAEVHDSVTYNGKKITVYYLVEEHEPYRLRNIENDFHNDTTLGSLFTRDRFSTTKLATGNLFDTDVLNAERDRLTDIARKNGYYYFTKDYISYTADSSLRSNQVDIKLVLKPYMQQNADGTSQEVMHPRYRIRDVNVLTLPRSTSSVKSFGSYDSTSINDNIHIFYEKKPLIRKMFIDNNLKIRPGTWYNTRWLSQTYNRFSGLGIVRSAEISYYDPKTEDHLLDCNVVLRPNKTNAFSLDLEGTNSSGDLGFAVTGTLQNKNLFRGSELLSLKGRFAEEAATGSKLSDVWNDRVTEYGVELSLKLPQFVFPFLSQKFRRRINASTEFTLAYNDQNRTEYTRKIFTAEGKYAWTAKRYYNFTVDAFNINYVYLPWVSADFENRYSDAKYSVLRESYKDHLILSAGASLNYNNNDSKRKLNHQSVRVSYESAGNLLFLLANVFKFPQDSSTSGKGYKVADIPFSQYEKGEFDYAYNHYINEKNRIVFHGKLGLEYPYANDLMVPFEKRFFGGGANGVRGWSVRTLGPGGYNPENDRDFVSQSGNMELVLNAECRSKLFWILEGAAFVDAGNIWNLRNYEYQHGGTFYIDQFYKQIALACGLGLRFDFTYFICRFDLGMKCYDPATTEKGKPVNRQWFRSYPDWNDRFALHFAIGYPF